LPSTSWLASSQDRADCSSSPTRWIGALGIHYKLAINGLNITLILLTAVLFTVSLFWSAGRDLERPRLYFFWFGMAESAVLGPSPPRT